MGFAARDSVVETGDGGILRGLTPFLQNPLISMVKKTDSINTLCTLFEKDGMSAELFREGEGFLVSFPGTKKKDRTFDSLPNLLSGLHGVFLELRMGGMGIQGLEGLARVSDDARQDVLAASRKIHNALES